MTRVAAREGQFCTELRPAMPGRTMPRKHRPTPYETARLTIHLVKAFDEEHERKTTRFRLSQKTLRLIALRSSLRDVFIEEWRDELAGLAWAAFRIDDNFGLIERGTVNGWNSNWFRSHHRYTSVPAARDDEVIDEIAQQVVPDTLTEDQD